MEEQDVQNKLQKRDIKTKTENYSILGNKLFGIRSPLLQLFDFFWRIGFIIFCLFQKDYTRRDHPSSNPFF
jgi:hypothetical protein